MAGDVVMQLTNTKLFELVKQTGTANYDMVCVISYKYQHFTDKT